jgi:hypothetical protein
MNSFFIPGLMEMWVACGSKFGKAQHIDTPIPTPDGWRVLDNIKEGDFVFNEHGKPTLVEYVTDTMYDHKCYEVVFSDGNKVIADAEHLWVTTTHNARKNIARCKITKYKPETVTTEYIKDTLLHDQGDGRLRPNHSIPCVTAPLQFKEKNLTVNPYVLGFWLGDGSTSSGRMTSGDKSMADSISAEGYPAKFTECGKKQTINVIGLMKDLRSIGVLNNKHVPNNYLTASPDQRMALLQGLMDSDGTIDSRGHCCFDNTNLSLADAVESLAVSFGIKVNRASRIGKLYGVEKKLCYRVWFTTDLPVFRLKRQLERLRPIAEKAKRRYIVEVNEVASVPVKCIRVSNPTHLFLCGKGCIPTHNTFAASTALSLAFPIRKQALFRWIAPVYSQSKIGFKYVKRILPPEPHVRANESHLSLYMPSNDSQIQFFHGQNAESIEGEATAGNILDEAAKMKEEVYSSVKTTTTVTKGIIVGISTPKGKNNWFYRKCMEAKEEMIRARFENRRPTKIYIHAPSWTNPSVSMDIINDAKRTMPERLWKQYYCADFLADGSCFSNLAACYDSEYLDFDEQFLWTAEGSEKEPAVIGVDWARTVDFTVFIAVNPKTRRTIGIWRMRGISYVNQVQRIKRFAEKFASCETVWHDKTGVGVALDDMLHGCELPFRGITFTNASKNEMMVKLMVSFEEGSFKIPQINSLVDELNDIEVKTTLTGLPTYSAPDGSHDDIVMSLALAHSAMLQHSERDYGIIEF